VSAGGNPSASAGRVPPCPRRSNTSASVWGGGQVGPALPGKEEEGCRAVPSPTELVSEAIQGNKHPEHGGEKVQPQRERLGRLLRAEAKLSVCHLPSACSGQDKPGTPTKVQEASSAAFWTHAPSSMRLECRKMSVSRGSGQKGCVGLEARCGIRNSIKHPVVYPNMGAWLWLGKACM